MTELMNKPACLRASHFGRCWTVLDHFSFPLECNSLPCLLHLGIWDFQEVEFLGKGLARLRGRIKVTNNTVHGALRYGELVPIYWNLLCCVQGKLHSCF